MIEVSCGKSKKKCFQIHEKLCFCLSFDSHSRLMNSSLSCSHFSLISLSIRVYLQYCCSTIEYRATTCFVFRHVSFPSFVGWAEGPTWTRATTRLRPANCLFQFSVFFSLSLFPSMPSMPSMPCRASQVFLKLLFRPLFCFRLDSASPQLWFVRSLHYKHIFISVALPREADFVSKSCAQHKQTLTRSPAVVRSLFFFVFPKNEQLFLNLHKRLRSLLFRFLFAPFRFYSPSSSSSCPRVVSPTLNSSSFPMAFTKRALFSITFVRLRRFHHISIIATVRIVLWFNWRLF